MRTTRKGIVDGDDAEDEKDDEVVEGGVRGGLNE